MFWVFSFGVLQNSSNNEVMFVILFVTLHAHYQFYIRLIIGEFRRNEIFIATGFNPLKKLRQP